jgi:hypothetical protein
MAKKPIPARHNSAALFGNGIISLRVLGR